MAETEYLVVLATLADAQAGVAVGRAVVEEGLAACVQVIPGGTAIYRWQGQLCIDPMAQLLIKTRAAAWPRLQARLIELHSDATPEILALPVNDGLPAYLRWLDEGTAGDPAAAFGWRDYAEIYPAGRHTVVGALKALPDFASPQLGNRRPIVVYLPPSYAAGNRRYPVLYMHDGQNLFDAATSYAGEWYVDETLEALAGEGIEAIVVGIPNIGDRRFNEYIPFPAADLPDAQGDLYVAFIADTLKPVIDRSFRTRPEREATGIAGSSLGGLISLYAFFRRPAIFGLAGVFSPSLRWGDGGIFPFVEKSPFAPGRVYLDVGTAEGVGLVEHRRAQRSFGHNYVRRVRRINALLARKGYRPGETLRYVEEEGAIHHESAWARRLPDALRFLLGLPLGQPNT
jgi:predicted alpha/beta superfamily hydrolase/uncharacterized protein involved in tolerance to divalent cations